MPNFPFVGQIAAGAPLIAALNSYAYLDTQISAYEVQNLRKATAQQLIKIARSRGIGGSTGALTVRDILPATDLTLANEVWITPALVANAWTNYTATALANNRCVGFYGVACRDATIIAERIQFQSAGGGATYADVDIFGMYVTLNTVCYFVNPIFYGPTDTPLTRVYASAAGTSRLQLLGLTVEPGGIRISQNVLADPNQ